MGSGVGIFVEGTDHLVCWDCAVNYSPVLAQIILLTGAASTDSENLATLANDYQQALQAKLAAEHLVWEIEGEAR
jgi:hypothetical protein